MSVYLGSTFIGNGNYLGNLNIPDAGIFVPPPTTTTTTTAAPTTTTTTLFAPQYFNVRKCGTTSPITQLGIVISTTQEIGFAVRPTQLGVSPAVALPGYENACYELVSTATSGTICAIRAPAINCAQSVCTVLPTTTTTTTAAP